MTSWRIAKSLDVLRKQLNEAYPKRSKASDGSIGDTAHSARKSDHNPNSKGVVQAIDITHDPANGLDARRLADALFASKDKRIKYIISNGQIASGYGASHPFGVWRKYNGSNAHRKHVHISVRDDPKLYDSLAKWKFDAEPEAKEIVLKEGATGKYVEDLQTSLTVLGYTVNIDGDYGKKTKKAVEDFQRDHDLLVDGWAGSRTLTAIGEALKAKETKPKIAAAKKVVNDAAGSNAPFTKTEAAAGLAIVSTGATAVNEATDAVNKATDATSALLSLGPWVLLLLVVAAACGYIIWDRRQKRKAAQAAQEVME